MPLHDEGVQLIIAQVLTRFDYEYERNGTANVFMFCEPLAGWRQVSITDHRTRQDWADQIRELLDVHYPRAERVTLVMDNLNTHSLASLYEAFEPAEARRMIDRQFTTADARVKLRRLYPTTRA